MPRRDCLAATSRKSAFVGRDDELAVLGALLDRRWHVTIVGTAGIGKSRLAAEILERRGHPYFVCDLTQAREAEDVVDVISRVLGVEPGEGRALDRIAAVLVAKGHTVLALDGADRLSAGACDESIVRLLDTCPELHVLVTARSRTRVEGEAVFPLGPLSLEANGDEPSAADALFLDLAERVLGRDLREDGRVPSDVMRLVRALDGIPLALEIAASALSVSSPREFVERGAFLLDAPAPSRAWAGGSLRAAFEVSWDRLAPDARDALQALSVFVCDFDLEAAEAVVGLRALDLLAQLCDASFVSATARGAKTRFRLFECVRQFSCDRGVAVELLDEARARHATYFGTRAATWTHAGESRERSNALEWLRAEETNLVAIAQRAVDTSAASPELVECGASALAGLAWLWLGRGALEPHVRLLDRMSALVRPTVLVHSLGAATFQLAIAIVWRHAGDLERAAHALEDAVARARRSERPYFEARCLLEIARVARLRGDRAAASRAIEAASALGEPGDDLIRIHTILARRLVASLDEPSLLEASRLARSLGDPLVIARVELAFAAFCYAEGRSEEALDHVRLVDAAADALGQRTWRALAGLIAGNALAEQGRTSEARRAFEATLQIGIATAHRRSEAEARANLALLDFEEGHLTEASEGLSAATALFSKKDPTRLYFVAALAGVEASHPQPVEGASARFFDARDEAERVAPAVAAEIDRFGQMFELGPRLHETRGDESPTTAALSASRVARRVRENIRARLARQAIVVAHDGTWFRVPGKPPVSLSARPVLSCLLRVLAREKEVLRDDLMRAIWPDERSSRRSMGNRLSVAISTLRGLGLNAIVASTRGVSLGDNVTVDAAATIAERKSHL